MVLSEALVQLVAGAVAFPDVVAPRVGILPPELLSRTQAGVVALPQFAGWNGYRQVKAQRRAVAALGGVQPYLHVRKLPDDIYACAHVIGQVLTARQLQRQVGVGEAVGHIRQQQQVIQVPVDGPPLCKVVLARQARLQAERPRPAQRHVAVLQVQAVLVIVEEACRGTEVVIAFQRQKLVQEYRSRTYDIRPVVELVGDREQHAPVQHQAARQVQLALQQYGRIAFDGLVVVAEVGRKLRLQPEVPLVLPPRAVRMVEVVPFPLFPAQGPVCQRGRIEAVRSHRYALDQGDVLPDWAGLAEGVPHGVAHLGEPHKGVAVQALFVVDRTPLPAGGINGDILKVLPEGGAGRRSRLGLRRTDRCHKAQQEQERKEFILFHGVSGGDGGGR